jgi:ubiquinone/menaquinone biosynthesis C-methylase UbiE
MGFRPLWSAVAEIAAPQKGEAALDVCTGTGGVALELACRGARVIGVDLASGMLRRACRKRDEASVSNGRFLRMDARQLAFGDRAFPLVTASMALHEMADVERRRVLYEIARVASDRVVIAEYRVPQDARRRFWFRVTRFFEQFESDDFGSFVAQTVAEQLEQAGLRVATFHDVGAYRVWRCPIQS